jgi:hypothetical protein
MSSAVDRLKDFESNYSAEGKKEINTICYAHAITIDLDEENRFSYCGADVFEGKLRIVFKEGSLGTNAYYALDPDVLMQALNNAPTPPGSDPEPISYTTRVGIRTEYDPKIEESRKKIADMLAKPDLKLVPNFEAIYARLKEESKKKDSGIREDFERQMGYMLNAYFAGLAYQMEYQKFGEDDLITEGFNEVVESGEIHFRIVDKLEHDSYGECVVEDGKLFMQVSFIYTPEPFSVLSPNSLSYQMTNISLSLSIRPYQRPSAPTSITAPRTLLIDCKRLRSLRQN